MKLNERRLTAFGQNIKMKYFRKSMIGMFAIVIAIACTFSICAAFKDAKNSPYENAINALADIGLVVGINDKEFGTEQNVTRQQMALFIARLRSGLHITGFEKESNRTPFTDLTDPTYYKAISYCYDFGIIAGRTPTAFDPTGNVTVQEAVTMAVRALGYTDLDYPDGYMKRAELFGLLKNLEDADPKANMKRGQVAQLIYNALYNPHIAGKYGKSFHDIWFTEEKKLGYFEIATLEELKQNYKCEQVSTSPYYWRVNDVSLFGYKGDMYYDFKEDGSYATIEFKFDIQGEFKNDPNNPFNGWVENSAENLSAEEAKALMDSIAYAISDFADLPITNVTTSDTHLVTSYNQGPKDIYKATAEGYKYLYYDFKLSKPTWSFAIITTDAQGCIGGVLSVYTYN